MVIEWLGISEGAAQGIGALVLVAVLAVGWYRADADWDEVEDGA